jgi:hypothetical protein
LAFVSYKWIYFDEHLSSNPNSEIIGELNRINIVLQGFITNIEAENLRRTERFVLLAREKYEVDKVLEECQIKDHNAYFAF